MCPQNPLFPCAKALPAKRNEKGYGDENASLPLRQVSFTGHRSQVTGHRSRVTGHGSQVTGHRSQVTGHRSQFFTAHDTAK